MEKVTVDIVEKGKVCELKKDRTQPGITDDCEKLLYLALAEGKKQPTQIQIKKKDGTIKRTIFVPEKLHAEELKKRDELVQQIGLYMKEVVQLPEEVYSKFLDYIHVDEVYDHLLMLLESKGWGNDEDQTEIKYDRGDEIQRRDNVVHLTADFLQFYGLATPILIADFYNYPEKVSVEQLKGNLQWMIDQKQSEVVIIYVVDNPFVGEDLKTELLPIFVEEEGHLKIVAWISPEVIPQNLIPIFDIEQNHIGWLDANKEHGKQS